MSIRYAQVVPWGRNYDEYVHMFDLRAQDLRGRLLGCGDGPASFNVECSQRGGRVTSVDPIYHFSREELQRRIDATTQIVLQQTEAHREKFRWDSIRSIDALGRIRRQAMQRFLNSYETGKAQGKYVPGELPRLPFAKQSFDLALSSHFLFLYSDNLTYDFHVDAIREMLRVAREVRIFPLLDINARPSRYLDGILEAFQAHEPEVRRVNYEFQRGGNQMLRLQAAKRR